MHFLLAFILCVSTFFSCSFAYAEEYSQEVYSAFEGDPAGIIKNSVDVISGSYREYEEDLVISSCAPLTVKRSYTSSRGVWCFFPECLLTVGKNEQFASGKQLLAVCPEANGTRIIYTTEKNDTSIFKPNFTLFNKGVVNTAKGACGAATHLKNNSLKSVAGGYELTTCNGTLRFYEKSPSANLGPLCTSPEGELSEATFYRLVLETLPSGNKRQYNYDNAGLLSSIHSLNNSESKEFSSLHFIYDANQITVQASNGQSVVYLEKFKKQYGGY